METLLRGQIQLPINKSLEILSEKNVHSSTVVLYSLEDLARWAAVLVLPLLADRARGHGLDRPPV